jgi:hypothetical protein
MDMHEYQQIELSVQELDSLAEICEKPRAITKVEIAKHIRQLAAAIRCDAQIWASRESRQEFEAAIRDHVNEESDRYHILTIGSPTTYALRITMGKLLRTGKYRPYLPCVFLIWKGKRIDLF